jgi:outer membrane receptor protein involved in Fe transport
LPDETANYEIGMKGDLFDRVLSYDLSVYTIAWDKIQVTQMAPIPSYAFTANGGSARSRGIEASFELRPATGLTFALWGSYNDAELREELDGGGAAYAADGDRLPYSSRYSGRASVQYETNLSANVTGNFGASASYVGHRVGEFVGTEADLALRERYPSYVQIDLNAGFKMDDWGLNLFVQNLTNKAGLNGGGYNNQYNFNSNWYNYIQPRTMGISIDKSF